MAKRPTLSDITTGHGTTTKINANFDAIEQAFDNTLSRDGSSPNAMEADLDMNSNQILNLPDATTDREPLTYGQYIAGGASAVVNGFRKETQTATAAQTVFTATSVEWVPGIDNLIVFVNGELQGPGLYTVDSSTQITFTSGLTLADRVDFVVMQIATTQINTTIDAGLVSYNPANTTNVTNVETKLRESVSVKDFGAVGDGVTDDWAAIQAAIDAGVARKQKIYFPAPVSKYLISRPLVIDDGQTLVGESRETCIIEKTTSLGPSPALGIVTVTRGGSNYNYDYDQNALVILKKPTARSFSNGVGIYNLSFQAASGVTVDYGIYAPLFSRANFNQVSIYSAKTGVFTYNAFMNSFNRVEVWTCEYGFRWSNDGSGIGSGTSCVFTDCWVRTATVIAFDFYGLVYSTLTSCAAEDVRDAATAGSRPEAYQLNLCRGVSLVACGCEGVQGYVFRIVSGGVSILGGNFFGLSGDTFSGDTATVFVDDAKVTIEGSTIFGVTASPGNIYNEIVKGANALLIYDGSVIRPTGGNTNPLFTGGGEIVVLGDVGQGLSTRTSTGLRNACLKESTVIYDIIDGSVVSTGSAQTIYTMDSGTGNTGMYIVNTSVASSGSTYRSVAIVVTDGIDANSTTLVNGASLVISVSGLNIQVAAAASGVGILYTIQKIL